MSWMNSGRKEDMMLAARSGVDTADASKNAPLRTCCRSGSLRHVLPRIHFEFAKAAFGPATPRRNGSAGTKDTFAIGEEPNGKPLIQSAGIVKGRRADAMRPAY